MKKIIFINLLLCSCAGLFTPQKPAETIRDPQCFTSRMIKIAQVADDVVLVKLYYCDTSYPNWEKRCSSGYATLQDNGNFFAVDKKEFVNVGPDNLYDDMKLMLIDKCAVANGTYSYFNSFGSKKTVRKISFKPANVPNPEYKKWKEEQELKNSENKDTTRKDDN